MYMISFLICVLLLFLVIIWKKNEGQLTIYNNNTSQVLSSWHEKINWEGISLHNIPFYVHLVLAYTC